MSKEKWWWFPVYCGGNVSFSQDTCLRCILCCGGGLCVEPQCGKVLKNKKSWREMGCEENTCWAAVEGWRNWKQLGGVVRGEMTEEKGMDVKAFMKIFHTRSTQPLYSAQKHQVSRKALVFPVPAVCSQLFTASSRPPMFVSWTRPWVTNAGTLTHLKKKNLSPTPSTDWWMHKRCSTHVAK